jgi:hypothetical protein
MPTRKRASRISIASISSRSTLPVSAAEYPLAAMEVAHGNYTDLAHHYVAVGKECGYRLKPG